MIQKVLKKILLWLFDSGNNEVFAKAINDIENEIIQKNKVMKSNEAPVRIWIDLANDLPKLSGHIDKDSVEYVRKDAFIKKLECWMNENFYQYTGEFSEGILASFDRTEDVIEDFEEYLKK